MPATTLYRSIRQQGLSVEVVGGDLHVSPTSLITDSIRAAIRQTKRDLIDFLEAYEERAAIMEFDGGMTREAADSAAFLDCQCLVKEAEDERSLWG